MSEKFEKIIFYQDLTAEQVEALRSVLSTDPEAAEVFHQWRRLQHLIGEELDDVVRDREMFALCALHERGPRGALTPEEMARVEEAAASYRAAIESHPGLRRAADDLGAAALEFDQMWDSQFEERPGADRPAADVRAREDVRPPATRRQAADIRPAARVRQPAHGRRASWGVRTAIAAAVVVFVGLLVILARQESSTVTVATAADEVRMVELTDGSSVRLLGNSSLSYVPPLDAMPFGRQVTLQGRAFFEITPDDRGFIVNTQNARATVLGTSFGVVSTDTSTEVLLADGRLSLASLEYPENVVVLEPGQMSRVIESNAPTAPVAVVIHDRLAWTGLFVFNSTPLEEILEELASHFGTSLTASAELMDERVTGRFSQDQPLREILQVVAAAVGAEVRASDNGYQLVTM